MTDFVLTDALIQSALRPGTIGVDLVEAAAAVSARTRATRQRSGRLALPWLPSPAATMDELRRARLMRVVLSALLLAAAAGVIAAGASLIPPPSAPPQWLLLKNGEGYTVPFTGGERRSLAVFAGLGINDLSASWDGTRLATVRGARNDVVQIWNAAAVFAERASSPATFVMPREVRLYDAGVWRRDDTGILIAGSDHGATRLYLLDAQTGTLEQLTPDGVNVDDWQPSPNGQWVEIAGQTNGINSLYLLDLEQRSISTVLKSDGKTIPSFGALGWSPDSAAMTAPLERGIIDRGIWVFTVDGSAPPRRLTPEGQKAWTMNWSPDGAWVTYHVESQDQECAVFSVSSSRRHDTWVIRSDGTEAHEIAPFAFPMEWAEDSQSLLVESQIPRPEAPLGGVVRVYLDGRPSGLVYPYGADDKADTYCHVYGVWTRSYHGNRSRR